MLESEIRQHFAEMTGVEIEFISTGFFVKFPNGYTLSVQQSEFHYSGADTAEIAAIGPDNDFVWPEQVRGYQTPEEIVEAIKDVGTR